MSEAALHNARQTASENIDAANARIGEAEKVRETAQRNLDRIGTELTHRGLS